MMSELSVEVIDNLFREVIMPHRAAVAVLQCGIIEAALRILPKSVRDILRVLPGGTKMTRLLYGHRRGWLQLLNRLHVQFVDLGSDRFIAHLQSIHDKCLAYNIRLVVLAIPLLSDQCERDVLPGTSAKIRQYNSALERLCGSRQLPLLDPFGPDADPSRDSLYLNDSVHFSPEGHQLIASRIVRLLRGDGVGNE